MHSTIPALVAAFCLAPAALIYAAPPQVNYLFPAGGQAGQTVNVTASGTLPRWPTQVWTSRGDVVATLEKDKGKLSIQIAADAPPSLVWLRLYDDEGTSAARPFLVGTLPEANEQEPNDDRLKPHALSAAHVTVNGQLAKNGDVDTFAVPLAKGQTLVAALEANRTLGSPMDGVLQVVSSAGFVLAQNNDDHGLDPLLPFVAPADGTYLVRVFAFPATPNSSVNLAGGENYIYRLTLTTGGFVDAAWPLAVTRGEESTIELLGWNLPEAAKRLSIAPHHGGEPVRSKELQLLEASRGTESPRYEPERQTVLAYHRDAAGWLELPVVPHRSVVEVEATPERPQRIELPATITGRISQRGEMDVYAFAGQKGQKLQVKIEARELGYPLDPTLKILDAAGKVLAQGDDTGRESRDAELSVNIAADGECRVQVRDLHKQGGTRYLYRLSIAPVDADFALRVAAESFTLPKGKPLEIPVTIERTGGLGDEIEIAALGLPEGVTAEPVKSQGKGDSAKQVKLKLTATTGPHSLPLRIVGRTGEEQPRTRIATMPLPAYGASLEELWLSVEKP